MSSRAFLAAFLLCLAAPWPAAAQEPKRFLFFGDSITIGHGEGAIRCPDPIGFGGYPPRLRELLRSRGLDIEVLNHAACGERTDAGLTRIDSVLSNGGDVVVIMEGTNDISQGVALETTLFNLREMARKANAVGIEPLLSSVVPRGPDSDRDSNNGKTYQLSLQLGEIAATGDWEFADPFDLLFGLRDFFELFYFDQLHPNVAGYDLVAISLIDAALAAERRANFCGQVPAGPCIPGESVLCLSQGRFRVEMVEWEGFDNNLGVGHAVPLTDDTGAFYFFDPNNIELVIKMLDGTAVNGYYWVYYGALSNLKYTILITDMVTWACREYFNPLATFASVGDTTAFAP